MQINEVHYEMTTNSLNSTELNNSRGSSSNEPEQSMKLESHNTKTHHHYATKNPNSNNNDSNEGTSGSGTPGRTPGEGLSLFASSRIPVLSPGSFRRSVSLRLRENRNCSPSVRTKDDSCILEERFLHSHSNRGISLKEESNREPGKAFNSVGDDDNGEFIDRRVLLRRSSVQNHRSDRRNIAGISSNNKYVGDIFYTSSIGDGYDVITNWKRNLKKSQSLFLITADKKVSSDKNPLLNGGDSSVTTEESSRKVNLSSPSNNTGFLENSGGRNIAGITNNLSPLSENKHGSTAANVGVLPEEQQGKAKTGTASITEGKVMIEKNHIKKESITKRDTNGMSLNLNGPVTTTAPTTSTRTPKTPHTPKTPLSHYSKTIPRTPKTPPVTPDSPHIYLDDDLDSLYSYSSATSGRSTMSCEHPYVARNGTTFSGRKMKYVVHCSSYAGQVGEEYLTPTQRAQRQIRKLKELLTQARQDLEQKDSEILRLTREVVELRLFKASLSSPEDRSNSSDAVTVREATTEPLQKTSQDVSPIIDMISSTTSNEEYMIMSGTAASTSSSAIGTTTSSSSVAVMGAEGIPSTSMLSNKSSPRHLLYNNASGNASTSGIHQVNFIDKLSNSEMQSSYADSGHFEDITTSSIHSKDDIYLQQFQDKCCGSENDYFEEQRKELISMYEKRIEELVNSQDAKTNELKNSHNDRVEALLQKLAECNTRYADIVPDYEQAKERIRELEKQLEDLQRKLQDQEDKQNKMYLHMYTKEQEDERIANAEKAVEMAHRMSSRVSIPELLTQLQSTQEELENIRAENCRSPCGSSQVLLTAKEAISLWVVGARKTIYRRLLEAQETKTRVDPEVTLQFLKSAIYYFLTDKENSQGHLNAIQSILEFSEQEKDNINKARSSRY